MKTAIAILNWNGIHWLEKFLPNVLEFSDEAQVYVIDNASTDDSVAFVEKYFPTVKIIHNVVNIGFAGGYNEGLKSIKEEIYCLLNSDVAVTENWIKPIIEIFEKNPKIAAIQPKIRAFKNDKYFEFAGAAGGMMDNLGYPYCRGRVFDETEEDHAQYDDERDIFWASGCAMFIRREDFWRMNGFDARFFAHQEEIDLCWRLKNAGRKIFYTSQSTVFHVGGGTLNKQSPQKTYLNIRNNLTMLVKNLPASTLFWLIPLRLILDGVAGIYFGFKDGFPHLWAVVRAHFGFYGMFSETLKLRGKNQIKDYYQTKWLIFKHFL